MLVLKMNVLLSSQMINTYQDTTWRHDANRKGTIKSKLMHKKLTRLVRYI